MTKNKKNRLLLSTVAFSLVSSAAACAIPDTVQNNNDTQLTQQQTAQQLQPTTTSKAVVITTSVVPNKTAVTAIGKTTTTAPALKKHAKPSNKKKGTKNIVSRCIHSLETRVRTLTAKVSNLKKQQEEAKNGATWSKLYAYGPAVVTTPIVGQPQYDGGDLLINLPTINEDLALLKFNQKIARHYAKNNIKFSDRPTLMMSGMLEGWLYSYSKFNNPSKSGVNSGNLSNSTIELPTAVLEGVARVSSWVTGVMRFEYLSSRTNGSNLILKRGYITVGNLEKTPIYGSVGKMYVPFGVYNNYMITNPLTMSLARTEGAPILLGFNTKNGAYGAVYALKGTTYKGSNNSINMWGANLGYGFTSGKQTFDIGANYINSISDSLGMQKNDYQTTGGFDGFNSNPQLQKQVAATAVHALYTYAPFTVVGEYIVALDRFDKRDLSYNDAGARVRALDVEGIYKFNVVGKPSFVSMGYGRTWEALALNLPQQSYFVSIGTSWFKSTVQSIEYRHDINYGSADVATGAGKPVIVGAKNRDQIIANFKIYF